MVIYALDMFSMIKNKEYALLSTGEEVSSGLQNDININTANKYKRVIKVTKPASNQNGNSS